MQHATCRFYTKTSRGPSGSQAILPTGPARTDKTHPFGEQGVARPHEGRVLATCGETGVTCESLGARRGHTRLLGPADAGTRFGGGRRPSSAPRVGTVAPSKGRQPVP